MFLEQLDDVAWQSLGGAYGSARDIPEVLRSFLDPELTPPQADAAVTRLSIELCVEDTWLVEATPHALPFVLALAASPDVPARAQLLEVVLKVAHAARSILSLVKFATAETPEREQLRFAEQVQRALVDAHSLAGLLADHDHDVRGFAALLVAESARVNEQGQQAEARRALMQALARETHAPTKVAQVAALEQLGAHDAARPYLGDASFAVRVASALSLVHVDAPGAACFDVLAQALQDPEGTREQYGEASRYRPLTLTLSICSAGRAAAAALLPGLLNVLADSSPYAAEATLEPLLASFFAEGLSSPPTAEQAQVLRAVCEHRSYFRGVANPQALLARYKLPTARLELLDLADSSDT